MDADSGPKYEEQLKKALIKNYKRKDSEMRGFSQAGREESFCETILHIFTNPIFGGLVFAISGLYFIVTGIQYWITVYMMTVLGASAELAAIYFVFLCFTGPIVGCICGGIMTQVVGGYNSYKG